MNKTAIILALALVAMAGIAAAPTAAADTIVDCALWEGHPPEHCLADCMPPNSPLRCEHEDGE